MTYSPEGKIKSVNERKIATVLILADQDAASPESRVRARAILVPQKSTYEIQGKKFVYLVTDSATVKSAEIKIRPESGGQFFVVEDGLQQGDKIVLEGVAALRENIKIKPVPVKSDSVFKIKPGENF
ncbi:MAG: hypothetical protein EOO01_33755 [Chitinophagaceae bacterium]|nr:MAG: hypothetical protein EOO01_33755 [Chitinophagaceae bacterium]